MSIDGLIEKRIPGIDFVLNVIEKKDNIPWGFFNSLCKMFRVHAFQIAIGDIFVFFPGVGYTMLVQTYCYDREMVRNANIWAGDVYDPFRFSAPYMVQAGFTSRPRNRLYELSKFGVL